MESNEVQRKKHGGGQSGFTLIELLVVVAILGMIAVIATIAVSNTIKRDRLDSAAQQLRSDLQAVYTRVMSTQKPVFVRVDIANRKIDIMSDTAGTKIFSSYSIPTDISLSTTDITAVDSNWPVVGGYPMLECDFWGRTLDPNDGSQVSTVQTLKLTHVEMVTGELGPHLQYIISIYPLWNSVASKSKW